MPHRIKKDFRTLQARNTWISTMKSKGYNIKIEQTGYSYRKFRAIATKK